MEKIILSGGGDDIFKILSDLSSVDIYKDKSVSYMAIAAEPNPKLLNMIKEGFNELANHIKDLGAKTVALIFSGNIEEAWNCDTLIISGGDTDYLINVLKNHNFKEKLIASKITSIVGISAGAIALSKTGLGTKNGQEHLYEGLEIASINIVPHSNSQKRQDYKDMEHLSDYEFKKIHIMVDYCRNCG